MPGQIRITMATKDVPGDITKYIKKSEYTLSEAYMYDEAYEVKIMKGNDAQTLLFDKEGNFVMKAEAPKAAVQPVKTDTIPAKK